MSDRDSDLPPLHTQNPLHRFSNRATDYAKYRPSYPAAAIDWILQDLGNPFQQTAADIGAGTGISSQLIAERGLQVLAIEPNAAMRAVAEPHPKIQFRDGTAEQTGLLDQSIDLVLCCQAFHWFEPVAALREFHRILKPGGRIALMWNDRDQSDKFTQQYTEVIRRAVDPQFLERVDRKSSNAEALRTSPLFDHYSTRSFSNPHPLDRAGLVGIALSASYVPASGTACDQLILDLQHLYDQWTHSAPNGLVAMSYQTNVYRAQARH